MGRARRKGFRRTWLDKRGHLQLKEMARTN